MGRGKFAWTPLLVFKKFLYTTNLYFLNILLFATGTLASLPLLSIQAAIHTSCYALLYFMEDQRVSSPVVVKSLLASKWQLNTLEWLVGATSAHEVFCVGMMKNNEYIHYSPRWGANHAWPSVTSCYGSQKFLHAKMLVLMHVHVE